MLRGWTYKTFQRELSDAQCISETENVSPPVDGPHYEQKVRQTNSAIIGPITK